MARFAWLLIKTCVSYVQCFELLRNSKSKISGIKIKLRRYMKTACHVLQYLYYFTPSSKDCNKKKVIIYYTQKFKSVGNNRTSYWQAIHEITCMSNVSCLQWCVISRLTTHSSHISNYFQNLRKTEHLSQQLSSDIKELKVQSFHFTQSCHDRTMVHVRIKIKISWRRQFYHDEQEKAGRKCEIS